VRVGIQLPSWGVTAFGAQDCLALAQRAEQLGFDSVWVGDHLIESPQLRLLGGDGQLEALTMLGALAAGTRSILIGSCVVIPVRASIHTWVAFASLSHLAPGRVIAGLGAGGFAPEFEALGIDFAARGARLDDVIALFENWPSAEALHPSLAGWSGPTRPDPLVPIWLGTSSSTGRPMRRVAEHASGWFMTYPTVGEYRDANATLDALLLETRREPGSVVRSALLRCHLAGEPEPPEAPERLLAAHDRAIAELIGLPPTARGSGQGEMPEQYAEVRARHLIGGPEQVTERLLAYRTAGMEHAVVSFVPVTDSFQALDVFAREVLPALKAPVRPQAQVQHPRDRVT
jgi:alkanesulfonate monooxygenase SsuD/methylene tetrahydromethanopterin reductase-like flavin-dependent oxidoreductase (luciferase family)